MTAFGVGSSSRYWSPAATISEFDSSNVDLGRYAVKAGSIDYFCPALAACTPEA
jgi:hypothetical protein